MASKYKKRSDRRYLVQIQIGIQENGKPKYKNIYDKTIKGLEEKAATFRQELEKGIIPDLLLENGLKHGFRHIKPDGNTIQSSYIE